MKLSNFAGMFDSTFIFPARQEPFFRHGFHYGGWEPADTLVMGKVEVIPEPGAFIMTHSPPEGLSKLALTVPSADWVFWVVLGGFFLLTITKFYYQKKMGLLFSAVFSRGAANQLIRETSMFRFQSFLFLLAIYLVSVTLLLHQAFRYFDPGGADSFRDMILYLVIVGAFILFFLIKITLIRLAGFIFKNPQTASEYIQNMLIYNLFGGIVLLPLILLIHYGPGEIFLYIAFGIMAILMVLRFIRSIFVGLSDRKFSLFHLFLYLCTLEILPVLIIAKFVDKYFSQ